MSSLFPLVERLEQVREKILDYGPEPTARAFENWEILRAEVDRELRAICLEIAGQCVPDATA